MQQTLDDMEAAELAAAAAAIRTTAAPTPRSSAPAAGTSIRDVAPRTSIRDGAGEYPGDPRVQDGPVRRAGHARSAAADRPHAAPGRTGGLVLALLIGRRRAPYLFLPSATIVVTPKDETRRAGRDDDRGRSGRDRARCRRQGRARGGRHGRCHGHRTRSQRPGKRVEEAKASGTVRFRNKDFTSSNTIPAAASSARRTASASGRRRGDGAAGRHRRASPSSPSRRRSR